MRLTIFLLVLAAACERATPAPPSATAFYASTFTRTPSAAELTELGRALFADPVLSPRGIACARCHDPAHAYGPADDLAFTLGGARAVPSLRYLATVPRFDEHYMDPDGDGTDQGPAGGLTWDGRAATAHDQARLPLYSPSEMANESREDLIDRVRAAPVAARLRSAFGDDVLDDAASCEKAILLALEVFQERPRDFAPFSSKFDMVLRGQAVLAPAEARGRAIFDDPARGNCASCHPDSLAHGGMPLFTDFGYVALGVPRNRALAPDAEPAFFDLGLCGPFRTDLATRPEYCGRFRAPPLRNVATRRRFFHNGVYTTLADALRFYQQRPDADDLPARYRANLEPLPGHLSDADLADLAAFLATLTDADVAAAQRL